MAFEAHEGVVSAHADAVVGHPDEAATAGGDFDGDAGGLGVDGILDEFLHDRRGTFDDLAGGDLVGDVVGKQMDPVHDPERLVGLGVAVQGSPGREVRGGGWAWDSGAEMGWVSGTMGALNK